MDTCSTGFRLHTALLASCFFAVTCLLPLQTAEARKAEGRTRTSVHKERPRPDTRDIKRDRDINRNTNVNINKNVNVNVKGSKHYRYDDRYYHYDRHHHHHHDVGRAFAIGALTGLVVGTIISSSSMSPSCGTVYVNGYPYRQCGDTWFQPHYSGSQVNYVVVNPPR